MQNHRPIPMKERIVLLDVLRGAALFGILLINIHTFHTPMLYKQLLGAELWASKWDQVTYDAVSFFVQGKFYTLFSFLFGYGFYIFMTRAEQKVGLRSRYLYWRRLIMLLGIGLIHIIFFWWGDILTWYALAGMLLFAFYKQSSKTLLAWAIGINAFYLLLNVLLFSALMQLPVSSADEAIGSSSLYMELIVSSKTLYTETYGDAMRQRLNDMAFYLPNVALAAIFVVLPMFLIGLYVARKGWLADVETHIRTIRKIWVVTFFVGIGFTLLKEWGRASIDPNMISMSDIVQLIGMLIGDPALCFFYVTSGAMLVYYVPKWPLWNWLAAAGRMALTNYLLQTIICTTLFYGYGFGLYGQIGAIEAYVIALGIFGLQLLLSRWWMGRFAYGPIEKVWRMATYGRKG